MLTIGQEPPVINSALQSFSGQLHSETCQSANAGNSA